MKIGAHLTQPSADHLAIRPSCGLSPDAQALTGSYTFR